MKKAHNKFLTIFFAAFACLLAAVVVWLLVEFFSESDSAQQIALFTQNFRGYQLF